MSHRLLAGFLVMVPVATAQDKPTTPSAARLLFLVLAVAALALQAGT